MTNQHLSNSIGARVVVIEPWHERDRVLSQVEDGAVELVVGGEMRHRGRMDAPDGLGVDDKVDKFEFSQPWVRGVRESVALVDDLEEGEARGRGHGG